MIFSTLTMDTPTDHIANALSGHNLTGAPISETPTGGFARLVAVAGGYADEVILRATVTSIRRDSQGPVVAWRQDGRPKQAHFDHVITTMSPKAIASIVDLTPLEQGMLD